MKNYNQTLHTDEGIVLKRTKHLETDIRLVLFLRSIGKVSAVVKSAQRLTSKLKGLVEPFSESRIQVYLSPHTVHARVLSGTLIRSHKGILSHLDPFHLACKSCEVVNVLVPYRTPATEIYDILKQALLAFDIQEQPPHEVWIDFSISLLDRLGHGNLRPQIQGQPLHRNLALIESHLNRILPWRLKSDILIGHTAKKALNAP